jgi:hypothetical protein
VNPLRTRRIVHPARTALVALGSVALLAGSVTVPSAAAAAAEERQPPASVVLDWYARRPRP